MSMLFDIMIISSLRRTEKTKSTNGMYKRVGNNYIELTRQDDVEMTTTINFIRCRHHFAPFKCTSSTYLVLQYRSTSVCTWDVFACLNAKRVTCKCLTTLHIPVCLILIHGHRKMTKNTSSIEIPQELTIADSERADHRFTLFGIIGHRGTTINHGHYRTYIRLANGDW